MTAISRDPSVSDHRPTAGDKGSASKSSMRRHTTARHGADATPEHFRVRRFDADRTDEELTFEEAVTSKRSRRQLLWIDITGDRSSSEAETLAGRFRLDPRTRRALQTAGDRPHLALSGAYFHLRVAAEPEHTQPADEMARRDRSNVVISQHRAPIRFLDDLDDRIEFRGNGPSVIVNA